MTKKKSVVRRFYSKYKEPIWTLSSILAILDSVTIRGIASFLVEYFGVGVGLSIAASVYAVALMTFVILGGFQTASFVARRLGVTRPQFFAFISTYVRPIVVTAVLSIAAYEGLTYYTVLPHTGTTHYHMTVGGDVSGFVIPQRFGEQITGVQFAGANGHNYYVEASGNDFALQIPLNQSYKITAFASEFFGMYHFACYYADLDFPPVNATSFGDLELEC
jgi:hypothetical protein